MSSNPRDRYQQSVENTYMESNINRKMLKSADAIQCISHSIANSTVKIIYDVRYRRVLSLVIKGCSGLGIEYLISRQKKQPIILIS